MSDPQNTHASGRSVAEATLPEVVEELSNQRRGSAIFLLEVTVREDGNLFAETASCDGQLKLKGITGAEIMTAFVSVLASTSKHYANALNAGLNPGDRDAALSIEVNEVSVSAAEKARG